MCGCRYGLLKRDAYKEGTVSGTSSCFTPATTTNSYDANNNLYAVTDSGNAANNRSFVTDDAGRVLYKAQNGAVERQLIANGEVLGRFGGALADFNFGYTPISASFPKANPGTFAVGASDSLRSIAKAVYGDSSLWYLIAEANGLQSDKELRVGQTLNVPNRVTSAANNAGTFKPYDPSVVGDTAPTLPNPPPPPGKKGCGGLGKLIMVVVAVVATIATAGALAGASGSAVFSTGASVLGGTAAAGTTVAGSLGVIGTGMVAGAVGSIASQVAGNMLGVQDGFSWKSVALGAISAGATAGVGQALGAAGQAAGQTTLSWQQVAARAAVGNAITQGVGVITGLQAKFDWKGVAASAVGAGIGAGVGEALKAGNVFSSFGDYAGLARSTATGMAAGTAAAIMRGGKVAVQQVAIDAFGNALGESLAGANGQGSGSAGGSDSLDAFLALNDNFSGVSASPTFAEDRAMRDLARNPMGLATYVGNGSSDDPALADDHRNGSDVSSDNYNGSRRTITTGKGQGPLAAMAAMGFSDQQQRAMYGQLARSGQLAFDAKGMPLVQPGQELYVDLDDMSGARLGGRLIAAESGNRAAIAEAAQRARWDSVQAGAWSGRTDPDGPVWHVGGSPGSSASVPLGGLQRAQAHALGVYDAGAGAVEGAGYSFGVVGTPESRAAWATRTAQATVDGIGRLISAPGDTFSGWLDNLTGNDPVAIRQATAQVAGVAMSVGGGIAMGRLQGASLGKVGDGLTISANPANGNPAAIARGIGVLSSRQAAALEQLPDFGSSVVLGKSFGQSDLAALTAATGDEFAMFTTGGRRLVFRGNAESVPISPSMASDMAGQGWRWSAHTHPGFDTNVLRSSPGDQAVLGAMGGKQSALLNSFGQHRVFTPTGDSLNGYLPW